MPDRTLPGLIAAAAQSASAGASGPVLVAVSGPQGAGKSRAMSEVQRRVDASVVTLGLDDFYLTKDEREALARSISPLLVTRGPPGTHDLALLGDVIGKLKTAGDTTTTLWPRFDKRIDDRAPSADCHAFAGRPAVIVLEGWCAGATSWPGFETEPPINAVEARDTDGAWRGYQRAALDGPLAQLWDLTDHFVHIEAPDFETVRRWRLEQEASNWGLPVPELPEERVAWVGQFLHYFERITRAMASGARRRGMRVMLDERRGIRAVVSA